MLFGQPVNLTTWFVQVVVRFSIRQLKPCFRSTVGAKVLELFSWPSSRMFLAAGMDNVLSGSMNLVNVIVILRRVIKEGSVCVGCVPVQPGSAVSARIFWAVAPVVVSRPQVFLLVVRSIPPGVHLPTSMLGVSSGHLGLITAGIAALVTIVMYSVYSVYSVYFIIYSVYCPYYVVFVYSVYSESEIHNTSFSKRASDLNN